MLTTVSSHAEKIVNQKADFLTSIKNPVKYSFWAMFSEARQAQVHVSRAMIPKTAALPCPDAFSFTLCN